MSMVHFTDDNIDQMLSGKDAFIKFYSPSCGHCMRLQPKYDQLPSRSAIKNSGVIVGKVDCTDKGKETCGKFNVRGYPTLKYISRKTSSEVIEDYEGNREVDDMEQFVLSNVLPPIKELSDEEVSSFIAPQNKPVLLGVFSDTSDKLYVKFAKLAPIHKKNFDFAYTFSNAAAEKISQKVGSVILYRQELYKSPNEEPFLVASSDSELLELLKKHRRSIVELKTPKNQHDFSNPSVTVYLPVDPVKQKSSFRRFRNAVIRVAKKLDTITFTVADREEFRELTDEYNSNAGQGDIFIIALDKSSSKYFCKDSLTLDNFKEFEITLEQFSKDFIDGKLEKFIKSEPIPEKNDEPVKVVVAKTFDEIVLNDEKDVLIEFYAPWCGHCKALEPAYKELATLLKDEENLIIAKIDATANDHHPDFAITGFPTIFLSKAGNKKKPIQYREKRDVKSMFEWLKKNVKHPLKYAGDVPASKDEL